MKMRSCSRVIASYSINLISVRLKLAMNRKASAPSKAGQKPFAISLPMLVSGPIAANAIERNVVAATIHAWASAGTGWAKIATDPKTLTHAIAQATSSSSALMTALAAEAAIPSSQRTPNVTLRLPQATVPTLDGGREAGAGPAIQRFGKFGT